MDIARGTAEVMEQASKVIAMAVITVEAVSRDTIMASITGRVTRTMVQTMGAIPMIIMVLAGVAQEISVVTSGAQIRFVNVWEGICAVAFKVKRSRIWRNYDGSCSNTYST